MTYQLRIDRKHSTKEEKLWMLVNQDGRPVIYGISREEAVLIIEERNEL